ncbi:hypothetical protein KSF_087710 [Reticulibacter mediterranei]|uniref:Uncharacterized protein n=1 Tax=Reticulibacter mediterranei TaxID=2778369 RepID=A0A8J3N7K9_9CHLR|nr:hypothetical protein [Reticulibacter mediterranei]GHO98723.1 hypothetical protein KSF_087710 [Reticulibacter mediterranei]
MQQDTFPLSIAPSHRSFATQERHNGKKKPYEAFDTADKPCPYTEFRCVSQPSQSPQSRFFLGAVFRIDEDTALTLLYSFLAVEIRGRNLKAVRQAVQNGCCSFLQEFDEATFHLPHSDEPVIESLHFLTGQKLDGILSAYKAGASS